MGRIAVIGLTFGSIAVAALAMPASATEANGLRVTLDTFVETDNPPVVAPGEMVGIACAALRDRAPDNDVRVVLTISPAPREAVGFRKVLATEEELGHGAMRVRVPEVPDLANHTVDVDVYVIGASSSRNCAAGQMHIAESKPRSANASGKPS